MAFAWSENRSTLAALAALGLATASPSRAEPVSEPAFDEGRKFSLLAPREAARLSVDAPFPIYLFEGAEEECAFSARDAEALLAAALDPEGPVFRSLGLVFPEARRAVAETKLVLVIKPFGRKASIFGSYFLRNAPRAGSSMIALDCSSQARKAWKASLAHELAHALLEGRGHASWFEESVAQLLESEASGVEGSGARRAGEGVSRSARALALREQPPLLLDEERPLGSSASYGLSHLFGQYLLQRWGGWATIRALVKGPARGKGLEYLDSLARLAVPVLEEGGEESRKWIEKSTARGWLRFFAVAVTLNHPTLPQYRIEGWTGFERPAQEEVAGQLLAPGQFLRLASISAKGIHSELEGYRITADGGRVRIYPLKEGMKEKAGPVERAPIDFFLVLNLTEKTLPLH